jgi:hypothetical protein
MRIYLPLLCVCTWVACGGPSDTPMDGSVAEDGAVDPCSTPLDDETVANLSTGILDHAALRPGQMRTFQLGVVECCYVFTKVSACATWSVEPQGMGANIDQDGTLTIEPTVEHGRRFTVTADVENGRRRLTLPVYIYTEEGNPLFGTWSESARLDCAGGTSVPEQRIGELWFLADGSFRVTWSPFELYFDYWGDYSYDLGTGALELTLTGGNYEPSDVDGVGAFAIQPDGSLDLIDIWLGSQQGTTETQSCGHRFAP